MREIKIEQYDPKWAEIFEEEKVEICNILQDEIMLIDHIGSTAIPNLSAKPIIDILVGVKAINKINAYNSQMKRLGYQAKGEFGIKGRRYFLKKKGEQHTHHVHIFNVDDSNIWRHIHFKQYMINHVEDANKYEELKKRLAERFPHNIKKYLKGKNKFIKEIDEKAHDWFINRTFETERLLLRPFTSEDAARMHKLSNTKEIAEATCEMPYPLELYMVEEWIKDHREECEQGDQAIFVIELKKTNSLIGSVEFVIDKKTLEAEVGYWIGKPYWRKGYCMEAALEMLRFGFDELYFRRVFAMIFQWNTSSRKLLQKLGMSYEKTFSKYVDKWDREEEIEQYYLTRETYKKSLLS